jgi:hypothetical protein
MSLTQHEIHNLGNGRLWKNLGKLHRNAVVMLSCAAASDMIMFS